jgi:hypothetical protein
MPVLPLTIANISSPTRSQLDIVSAAMLWPAAEEERDRNTASFVSLAQEIPAMISEGVIDLRESDPKVVAGVMSTMRDAPPLDAIHELVKPRLYEGALIGAMIAELLGRPANPAHNLADAKRRAVDAMRGRLGRSVDTKTVDNEQWPLFRPVAHLWGAYLVKWPRSSADAFPCALSDFAMFLAVAGCLLDKGASFKTSGGRRRTLLDRESAWWLASDVTDSLPKVGIE